MEFIGILFLVIVGIFVCCIYPYSFDSEYKAMYGGKGLSYYTAGFFGLSILNLVLVLQNHETQRYGFAFLLVLVSFVLNIYRILEELGRTNVSSEMKIQFALCQFLFSVGAVLLFVILILGMFLLGGDTSKKRRCRR